MYMFFSQQYINNLSSSHILVLWKQIDNHNISMQLPFYKSVKFSVQWNKLSTQPLQYVTNTGKHKICYYLLMLENISDQAIFYWFCSDGPTHF